MPRSMRKRDTPICGTTCQPLACSAWATASSKGESWPPREPLTAAARAWGPRWANSRNSLRSRTARALVRLRSISPGSKEENTSISRRARVTATLRRRQPPSLFKGPKFIDIVLAPGSVGPKPMPSMIRSRSSPWTVSRFFTTTGSARSSAKCASISGCCWRARSSRSVTRRCCSLLRVMMPRLSPAKAGSSRRLTASATMAWASRAL